MRMGSINPMRVLKGNPMSSKKRSSSFPFLLVLASVNLPLLSIKLCSLEKVTYKSKLMHLTQDWLSAMPSLMPVCSGAVSYQQTSRFMPVCGIAGVRLSVQ